MRRIRFVFTDDTIRIAFALRIFNRNARAEVNGVVRLLRRIDDDRCLNPLLQICYFAFVLVLRRKRQLPAQVF